MLRAKKAQAIESNQARPGELLQTGNPNEGRCCSMQVGGDIWAYNYVDLGSSLREALEGLKQSTSLIGSLVVYTCGLFSILYF